MSRQSTLKVVVLVRVGKDLAVGAGKGAALGAGLFLLAAQVLLLLLDLDLVADGVDHLLELGKLGRLLEGVCHPFGVTLAVEKAVFEDPRLGAQLRAKLVVVRDHDDTALKLADGAGEGAERVAVEVVGGLVENENVGLVPGGCGEHDLDLLAAREGRHARVGAVLAVETDVFEVLLDVGLGEGLHLGALAGVDRLAVLAKAELVELLAAHPHVRVHRLLDKLDLVLDARLALAATASEALNDALLLLGVALAVDVRAHKGLEALLLLLLGELHAGEVEAFLVLAALKAPANVLVGRLAEMHLNVGKGVLGDEVDNDVGVLPHGAGARGEDAGEELDHGRLAGAVDTEAGDAARERDLDGNAAERGRVVAGVGKADVLHLHEGLALGLDALEKRRLGKVKLLLALLELKVRLGVGVALDKRREVALGDVELKVLDLDNVRGAVFEETGVVADHDAGDVLEAVEVVLDPLDVEDVQMVGGLVHEQNVGLLEHGAREGELHAPTTRERRDAVVDHLLGKADAEELLLDGLAGAERGNGGVGKDVVDASKMRHLALDVRLDKHGADFAGVGKALDRAVGNRAHERRLARLVGAEQAVAVSAEELEARVVEQNLRAVGEGKREVAEELGGVVVFLLDVLDHVLSVGLNDGGGGVGGGLGLEAEHERGGDIRLEAVRVKRLVGNERRAEVLDVRHEGHVLRDGGAEHVVDGLEHGLAAVLVAGNGLGRVGLDLVEVLVGAGGDGAGLGVGDGVRGAVEGRQELGQKGGGLGVVLDELAHVGDNDAALALDRRLVDAKAADENRGNDGEGHGVDALDKRRRGERLDSLGNVLGVDHGVEEGLDKGLEIAVGDAAEHLLEGHAGGLEDLLLRVPYGAVEGRHELGEAAGDRVGRHGALAERCEELEGALLGAPLDLVRRDDGDNRVNGQGHGVGVDLRGQGHREGGAGLADALDLVVEGHEDGFEGRAKDKGLVLADLVARHKRRQRLDGGLTLGGVGLLGEHELDLSLNRALGLGLLGFDGSLFGSNAGSLGSLFLGNALGLGGGSSLGGSLFLSSLFGLFGANLGLGGFLCLECLGLGLGGGNLLGSLHLHDSHLLLLLLALASLLLFGRLCATVLAASSRRGSTTTSTATTATTTASAATTVLRRSRHD
eukprot:m.476960 g.476960  ORF g.476960 m.476960 type:complete len:1145 (-) comp20711_c0_seq1:131-3565(-)